MASAVFHIKDTEDARKELRLLLQIEPGQLDQVSHNGVLTIEFSNLLEDKAMHVLATAVSNHGFQVSINHSPVKKAQPSPTPAPEPKTGKISKGK